MSLYFSKFPTTSYSLTDGNSVNLVTNIVTRFSFEESFKENNAAYYNYFIKDSDTPEILASKIYDSPEKHWMILNYNNIVDIETDWPLTETTLYNYIEEKYLENASVGQTGTEWAMANIHSYYKVETITISGKNTINYYQIDALTYADLLESSNSYTLEDGNPITIVITKETKSYYRYEIDNNDSKRTIKILRPEFAQFVEKELDSVLK